MESNSLNQTICMKKNRILFPQKIRHTAQRRVLPAAHQTRQECIIFLSVPEFFKEIWLSYPILPEFYQNSFCRTLKKESNSINLDFYKCLNFLLSILCSTRFLKNPIPSEQADNLILTTILSALRRRLTPTDYTLEN